VPLPEHRDQARWSSGRARERRSGRTSRDTTITRCAGIEYLATPELGAEHILACSAIPALFPAVRVTTPQQVADWYYDGPAPEHADQGSAVALEQ
jgi:hypothetical protein